MSDITKCANGCKKQLFCKRWTAPHHAFRQSMADFKPDPATGMCEGYYPNTVALAQDIEAGAVIIGVDMAKEVPQWQNIVSGRSL